MAAHRDLEQFGRVLSQVAALDLDDAVARDELARLVDRRIAARVAVGLHTRAALGRGRGRQVGARFDERVVRRGLAAARRSPVRRNPS